MGIVIAGKEITLFDFLTKPWLFLPSGLVAEILPGYLKEQIEQSPTLQELFRKKAPLLYYAKYLVPIGLGIAGIAGIAIVISMLKK